MLVAVVLFCHMSAYHATTTTTTTITDQQMMMMLAQQVMMQQTAAEEKTRTDGDSGIKQIRSGNSGTKSYYIETHVGNGAASIHDHANNVRTVGLGEFSAVMNGVDFRTRHNDYRLVMPHRTSKDYHAVEEIPFPDVPPEVDGKATPEDQIKEMREWFKAWKDQNVTHRNYPEYFKPILCYLEGAWTHSQAQVDEPFFSDRHSIDAETWFELLEKIRFTTYTGKKSTLENFSFLPTKLMGMINGTTPLIAQWNYRILCQPLDRDLPLNRLRLVEDLKTRLSKGYSTEDKLKNSRQARFSLNPWDSDKTATKEGSYKYGLLDELMYKVPGKDNQQGNISDDAFDVIGIDIAPDANGAKLNGAKYVRYSMSMKADAMGRNTRKAGFADDNLFIAFNTQERIAGRTASECQGKGDDKVCKSWTLKASYALPLEIVYLTPLSKWNPYNIVYKNAAGSKEGKTVTANGRNGKETQDEAYNGTHSRLYFHTPNDFFLGDEVNSDAADTSKGTVAVLDKKEVMRLVRASGIRVSLPNIEGLGVLRQRYPIFSIFAQGSTIWKELEALQQIVLKPKSNANYLYEKPSGSVIEPVTGKVNLTLQTSLSREPSRVSAHQHKIELTAEQVATLKSRQTVTVATTKDNGHSHTMVVYLTTNGDYVWRSCDNNPWCWDKHSSTLSVIENS